jgi:hypothetical protein
MVSRIATLLALDDTARLVIAVPTHKLGQGLADRINSACGSEVATEWNKRTTLTRWSRPRRCALSLNRRKSSFY